MRRLPTSAIETKCEHGSGSTEPRTPRKGRPLRSFLLRVADTPFGERPTEISRARGFFLWFSHISLSARDRSREELYPNPIGSDTSCRKPVSAGDWRSLRRRCALVLRCIHRVAELGHASAKPSWLGPPHTLPREGQRIPLHPRCLPSISPPSKGCALASPAPCCQGADEP